MKRSRGRIEIKNLSFTYPSRPDSVVCKGYNLIIEPGEVVALVGPSGSGKSTIMNLLLRFYDPTEGNILLDGTDLRELNVRWLRSQIGYVGQEPALFSGSVAFNISRGRAGLENDTMLSLDDVMKLADSGATLTSSDMRKNVVDDETGDLELGDINNTAMGATPGMLTLNMFSRFNLKFV